MKNLFLKIIALATLSFALGTLHVFSQSINFSSQGFIENKGQIIDQNYQPNPAVKFLLCRPGLNVQLRQTGFSYDTYTDSTVAGKESGKPGKLENEKDNEQLLRSYHRVDVDLLNCNPDAQLIASDTSPAYFNYFTAGTPNGGISKVHYYEKVIYKNIYPDIDLEFETHPLTPSQEKGGQANQRSFSPSLRVGAGGGAVEYHFIVHPGGKVSDIQLSYRGMNNVFLQNDTLKVQVTAGTFTENIPKSYLRESGKPVDVHYEPLGNNVYSFHLQSTIGDPQSTIVIDPAPTLKWGTYYGAGYTTGHGVAVNKGDTVCITGFTWSTTQIATSGTYQTIYTYAPSYQDGIAFVAEFSPDGSKLIWATYYGGTSNGASTAAQTFGCGIALDPSNNVYIVGYVAFADSFPIDYVISGTDTLAVIPAAKLTGVQTTPGAYRDSINTVGGPDTYIAEFSSDGTRLLWATYYGDSTAGWQWGYGIALDADNKVYIAGETTGGGIATPGAWQTTYGGAFAAKFDPAAVGPAQLVWGTYFGGATLTLAWGVALDAADNVYITGFTLDSTSSKFVTPGAYQTAFGGGEDAFVAKLDPTGSHLLWGTYYGGSGMERGFGIAVDPCDNVYITGVTNSTDSVATPGAFNPSLIATNPVANSEPFVAKFNSSGSKLVYGSYYGGSNNYNPGWGGPMAGITADAGGNAYFTGNLIDATGNLYPGGAFAAKVNPTGDTLLWSANFGTSTTNGDFGIGIALDTSNNVLVTGSTTSASGISTAGAWQTTYGNTQSTNPSNAFVEKFANPRAGSCNPCLLTSAAINSSADSICFGDIVKLTATGTPSAIGFLWNTGATTQSIMVDTAGNYSCIVYSCADSLSTSPFHVTVIPAPAVPDIKQQHDTLYFSNDTSYASYQWYDSTTLINGAIDTFLVITHSGNYNVKVQNAFGCVIAVGINAIYTPTGINEYSDNNYVLLSPNPAANQLNIHTFSFHNEAVTVSVMNVLGETIQEEKINWSNDISIEIKNLSVGIYFLQMKSESGSVTKKFVKE